MVYNQFNILYQILTDINYLCNKNYFLEGFSIVYFSDYEPSYYKIGFKKILPYFETR